MLDPAQQNVIDRVLQGRNVFFSGSAGTGKTFLLNEIIRRLKTHYGDRFSTCVAVSALTGIAATHVDGTTLNSALGITVPKKYADFRSM